MEFSLSAFQAWSPRPQLGFGPVQPSPTPQFSFGPVQPQATVQPSDQLIASAVRFVGQLIVNYPKEMAVVGGLACLWLWLGGDDTNRRS
jgi:hypothetical protein